METAEELMTKRLVDYVNSIQIDALNRDQRLEALEQQVARLIKESEAETLLKLVDTVSENLDSNEKRIHSIEQLVFKLDEVVAVLLVSNMDLEKKKEALLPSASETIPV